MTGTVVTTLMLVSLYAGFTFGFQQIKLSRQEARATQILQEKMEMVRILNWDQVATYSNYVPSSFNEAFYATDPSNAPPGGFDYTGQVTIATPSIGATYKNDLREVTVTVSWQFSGKTRTRTMSAYVSQWGMQNYVY